ncbi:MAG: flagellar protein FlaG [Zoogloeaceae bacterium]|nr:flagellar protein FlaG [Zoogloeaceae bacterium]
MSVSSVAAGMAQQPALQSLASQTGARTPREASGPSLPGGAVAGTSTTPPIQAIQQAVADLQETIAPVAQDLQFSIDKDSGRTVVKIVDSATDKVLRQIPSEEILAIAKALDKLQGLLVKQEA